MTLSQYIFPKLKVESEQPDALRWLQNDPQHITEEKLQVKKKNCPKIQNLFAGWLCFWQLD